MEKHNIIPEPVKILIDEGYFALDNNTSIVSDQSSMKNAKYLKSLLDIETGLNLTVKTLSYESELQNTILLKISNKNNIKNSEYYILTVSQLGITISATTQKGISHGIQTLRQLLHPDIENSEVKNTWNISSVKIEDYPRFKWRGFMLDESRHFFGKETVKKILDLIALFKLNVFHWHLTDDQGWRVEIRKYPLLTKIGSQRKNAKISSRRSKSKPRKPDEFPYSGYYSQEDIKEIVSYAKDRYINIIPEIDLPGHTSAVLASYPELSCTGELFEVSTHFGHHKDVLCVGKEGVFEFAQNVINELVELFPSKIIHIGGDEVPRDRWKKCSDCQARIKDLNLKNEEDLQVYFTNRISNYITSLNRIPMGWNEILDENLVNTVICQFWLGNIKKIINHIKNGRSVVMSDMRYVYFNYGYKPISLKKCYDYDPIPNELEQQFYKKILGLEACLWSEFILSPKKVEWHTFPRLIAIAETGWTPRHKKDFKSFENRLKSILKMLDFQEVNYGDLNEVIMMGD